LFVKPTSVSFLLYPQSAIVQQSNGHGGGGCAVFDAQLFEYLFEMFVDGTWADRENQADFAVGLALAEPHQNFRFLLATWGLSLQQLYRSVFGAREVRVTIPEWMMGFYAISDTIEVPINGIFVMVLTVFIASAVC